MAKQAQGCQLIRNGLSLLLEGKPDQAKPFFIEQFNLCLDDPVVTSGSSESLINLGEIAEAIRLLKIFFEYGRMRHEALIMLAEAAFERPDIKPTLLTVIAKSIDLPSSVVAFANYLAELEAGDSRLVCSLQSLQFALELDPYNIDSLSRTGLILITLGKAEEGMDYILKATTVDPGNPVLRYYQGKSLYLVGDYVQAIESLNDYIEKAPTDDIANDVDNLLAVSYLLSNDLDSSIEYSNKALMGNPDDAGALINASNAYRCLGEIDKCISFCSKALSLCLKNPRDSETVNAFYNLMFAHGMRGIESVDSTKKIAVQFWESYGINNFLPDSQREYCYSSGKKIKIAFLSSEIGDHVVSFFLESFLAYYARDKIEVDLLIGINRFEGSAARVASYASQVIDISGKSVDESRQAIRERKYDIIVDTSGVTRNSKLSILAHRCAPIQCHYIGYHATLGLETIDYIIADDDFIPISIEDQFKERIIRIPAPWIARHVPANLPLANYSGDSGQVVRLASFNQTAKISKTTLCFWVSALIAMPRAMLVIKDRFAVSKRFQERILSYFEGRGVATSRISFIGGDPSWEDHMRFYNAVDIVLDSTPWSAATTAFDAMAMGVPFVAIQGVVASSRMSSSVVKAANHADWIAANERQFAEAVNQIGGDIEAYRENRANLQKQNLRSALFSPIRLAENLSSLFLSMAGSSLGNTQFDSCL